MQARGNKILFASAALLLGLLFALTCCEVFLRLVGQPRTFPAVGLFEPDPRLGYRLASDYSGSYLKGGLRFAVRTNSAGFRDSRDYSALPGEAHRIVAVGDSFTFGMPVEEDQTLLAISERDLNSRAKGMPWQVLNLGVPSYGTRQEARVLAEWAPRLNPEIALVVFCLQNDFRDNSYRPEAPHYRAYGGIQVTSAAAEAAAGSLFGSFLFKARLQLARLALYDVISYRVALILDRMSAKESDAEISAVTDWESTFEAFEEVIEFSGSIDLEVSVLLIPDKTRVLDASLPDPERLELAAYLRKRGLRVFDPTSQLRDDSNPARYFETHGNHFSVAGNALVGGFLANQLFALTESNSIGSSR